jgi:hypothetical protein
LTSYQLQALAWVNIRIRYKEPASKFAKFEDVMDYAQEAAAGILKLDQYGEVLSTIKILAAGPRFKFKNKQDVIDTIKNADAYKKVYNLPPKNDVEAKAKKKAKMAAEEWVKMRAALLNDRTMDVYDLGVSSKKPVFRVRGKDRRDTFSKTLHWVLTWGG